MASLENAYPGPVFQRLRRNVGRPIERAPVAWRPIAAHSLICGGFGLAAAAGVAQAAGLAPAAGRPAVVLSLFLLGAGAVAGLGLLRSQASIHKLLRNPDAPLTRFAALAAAWVPLAILECFLLFVWSPGRFLEIPVGIEMALLGTGALFLHGAVRNRLLGVALAASGFGLGVLLFGWCWALFGEARTFHDVLTLLALGTVSCAVHLTVVRQQGAPVKPRFHLAFVGLSIAPLPLALVLSGLLGPPGTAFFLPAGAAAIAGVVLGRILCTKTTVRSRFFQGVGVEP
jgi:hypothetical protein